MWLLQTVKKAPKVEFESLGNQFPHLIGGHFTPHVLTMRAGEDISRRVLLFAQEDSHGICILSAIGSISNVTLRQPESYNAIAYEGFFDIVSLSGSFVPADNGPIKGRCGSMSITLAASDGTIFGGGTAGPLIAASPVQVVVGSFFLRPALEDHPKRQRTEAMSPLTAIPISIGGFAGQQLILGYPAPNEDLSNPADDGNSMHDSNGGPDPDADNEDEVVADDVADESPNKKLDGSG